MQAHSTLSGSLLLVVRQGTLHKARRGARCSSRGRNHSAGLGLWVGAQGVALHTGGVIVRSCEQVGHAGAA